MPVYSDKSGTQYAAPGPLPSPGPKLLRNCFTRLLFGSRVIFCCQAPWCLMLSMESMIAISSRRGGGGRQTFPVPLFRKNGFPHQCAHWLGMTRKFFRILSLRGRKAPVAIRTPVPLAPLPKGGDRGRGCPCCGAQNFCAASRRTLEILTAATRSPRFFCHWQRSVCSPRARCALAMTELESFPCHSEPVRTLVWESVFPWKAERERSAVLPRPGGLKWLSCFPWKA